MYYVTLHKHNCSTYLPIVRTVEIYKKGCEDWEDLMHDIEDSSQVTCVVEVEYPDRSAERHLLYETKEGEMDEYATVER